MKIHLHFFKDSNVGPVGGYDIITLTKNDEYFSKIMNVFDYFDSRNDYRIPISYNSHIMVYDYYNEDDIAFFEIRLPVFIC